MQLNAECHWGLMPVESMPMWFEQKGIGWVPILAFGFLVNRKFTVCQCQVLVIEGWKEPFSCSFRSCDLDFAVVACVGMYGFTRFCNPSKRLWSADEIDVHNDYVARSNNLVMQMCEGAQFNCSQFLVVVLWTLRWGDLMGLISSCVLCLERQCMALWCSPIDNMLWVVSFWLKYYTLCIASVTLVDVK